MKARYTVGVQWQDIILTGGGYVFIIALIPSIVGKDKPAFSSSLLTGGILGAYAIVYATIGLVSAAISTALLALAWLFLAWQKWRDS